MRKGNLKGAPIGNVDMTAVGAVQVALAVLTFLRGKVNTLAKEAEEYRVACAHLGVALEGSPGERDVLPICGRGPGRDTVMKNFYKGDGSDLIPSDYPVIDNVHVCDPSMMVNAIRIIEKAFGRKMDSWKRANPELVQFAAASESAEALVNEQHATPPTH